MFCIHKNSHFTITKLNLAKWVKFRVYLLSIGQELEKKKTYSTTNIIKGGGDQIQRITTRKKQITIEAVST